MQVFFLTIHFLGTNLFQVSSFLAASILLTLAPGPDILYVLAQSLSQGKRVGIITGLGLGSGILVPILMVSLGVATILKNSSWMFLTLKIAGAIYLFYLSYLAFQENNSKNIALLQKSQDNLEETIQKNQKSFFSLYRQGFYMSSLNPKVILFFLAFFPQFIDFYKQNYQLQIFILGFLFILQAVFIFTAVSFFADFFAKNFKSIKFIKTVNYGKAILLLGVAVSLLFLQKDKLL